MMTAAGSHPTLYTSHVLLLCEPLGAGSTSCMHPTAATKRIRFPLRGLLNLHIGGQTLNALLDVRTLNGYHLSEQRFRAFGRAPAQVAFAAFGTHHYPGPAQAKTLRGGFMGLEFDFAGF